MSAGPDHSPSFGGKAHNHLNVYNKPLGMFSKNPMTGYNRSGSCETGPDDKGNHSIAATLTEPFLDFTASRGNNLRDLGLEGGTKWCLCASRWKEAMDYAESQSKPKSDLVPKVHLHATNVKALDVIGMDKLKKYAAEHEAANASNTAQSRKGGMGGAIKERTELANKEEMTSR